MPSLRTLAPEFIPIAESFVAWAREKFPGSGLVVTSAFRTHAEQARLYARFLAGQNNGLPATPPGNSDHERGLAFDFARLNVDPLTDPVLKYLGSAWSQAGGKWWDGDPVHFSSGAGWGARGKGSKSTRRRRASRRNR